MIRFELYGRDATAGSMEPAVVEPVNPQVGVASLTSERVLRGPSLLISSALKGPMVDSARALS